ncbi:MAG: tail sheath stabilizer and completion protein [Candidatus Poseidoniales archaeon]|nr:tail sheath stabilizer and completion protein [Candidatus Poseidoniales archaeon]
MFGTTFYHGTTKKLIIAFGSVFNNIHVQHKEADGTILKDIKVPLAYESRKKYLARLIQDSKKNKQVPRMGFVLGSVEADYSRSGNQMQEYRFNHTDNSKAYAMFTPIPYNFSFTLDVYVDYMDDGLQIIEQILPYFQPDFNVVIEEVPELDMRRDIPIELTGVEMTDEFEGDFAEQRIVNWSLGFVMKGWIYPPIREQGIIKQVTTNYMFGTTAPIGPYAPDEQINLSVDPFSAGQEDNWTVAITGGHPDDPNDPNDVDTVTPLKWPLGD